jgi:ABC-2 type transport system permease protein
MSAWWSAARQAARGQMTSFVRAPVTTIFALVLPLNLLLLMSLFALTGYNAPTALVMGEDTPRAQAFVQALRDAHNSFELRPMDRDTALDLVRRGRLVAVIEIPKGFDAAIADGRMGSVQLTVDNVNLDMAEDVRRAIPAAAAIFAERLELPGVKVTPRLINLLPKDTGYVEYLGVSAVALAAVIAGGVLGGTVVAREWETGAARMLLVAPTGAGPVLIGRLAAAAGMGVLASAATALVVIFGYGVPATHPLEVIAGIVFTVIASTSLGGLLGVLLRRTLPITPLVLGTQLPFYLDSGALEPQRFDGEVLFWLAHLSPAYFGVGVMEHGYNSLVVTPEPVWLLLAVLALIAIVPAMLIGRLARR